jgi:CRP-like cAMP-binding protein
MSETVIAQLEANDRIRGLDLTRDELERLADLTEKLRDCPLFRRLPLGELAYIAQAGEVRSLERGQMLIRQGDRDRVMYVILEGQLRVWEETEQGTKQLLGYHYPGDYSGELIMISGDARIANIDAVEDSKVVAFDEEGWARISAHQSLLNRIQREGPERVRENTYPFEGKQLDEVIVERLRKSWVALFRGILAPALITIVALVVIGLLSGTPQMGLEIATSVGLAVVVAMFLWGLWIWQDWRNDDYIVTSKRVINVERVLIPPFPIERREVAMQSIQDLRTTNQGLWTILFGVKSIEIRTMGTGTIRFPDMDDADRVAEIIFQTQKRAASRTEIPGPTLIRQRLKEELGFEVPRVTSLDSVLQAEDDKPRNGWLGPLDYFVPYTRIKEPDRITWRMHWLFMLIAVLPPLLLGFGSLVLVILPLVPGEPWFELSRWVWVIPGAVLMLISFGWYLWRYEGWRNHVYQVTDSRIIDIEGTPFHLYRETRTEGTFDVIQNVTYDSPNWVFRALGIGFVQIDTAAEESAYTFDKVGHPEQVQQEIFQRWTAYREREKESAIRRRHQEFLDWIVEYDRLVRQEG